MMKDTVLIILIMLSFSVSGYEKKGMKMSDKLLGNDFDLKITVIDKNNFEKKNDDLYVKLYNPNFFLEVGKATLKEVSVPMVGVFHKKLSNVDTAELKVLGEYLLNNDKYINKESNTGIQVYLKDKNNALRGEFIADSEDEQSILFLRKRFLFVNSQLVQLNKFEVMEGLSVRHELQAVADDKLKINVYIKNIGQQQLVVNSPYSIISMVPPAPHMWYGIVLQFFTVDNHKANKPDAVFKLVEYNVSENELESANKNPSIVILPQKEKVFEFFVSAEQLSHLLEIMPVNQQSNTRVTLAFPFKINNDNIRVEIATEEQLYIPFKH